LSDVALLVEGERLPCHKIVLASASPYFRAMFTGGLREAAMSEVRSTGVVEMAMCTSKSMPHTETFQVRLHGVKASVLRQLLSFIYTGEVRLTPSNVCDLLPAATMLQLACVTRACCQYLLAQLHPTNCLGIHQFAVTHGASELARDADKFIERHFCELAGHEEFLELSDRSLARILACDRLHVRTEADVFSALVRWVHHNRPARCAGLAMASGRRGGSNASGSCTTTHPDPDENESLASPQSRLRVPESLASPQSRLQSRLSRVARPESLESLASSQSPESLASSQSRLRRPRVACVVPESLASSRVSPCEQHSQIPVNSFPDPCKAAPMNPHPVNSSQIPVNSFQTLCIAPRLPHVLLKNPRSSARRLQSQPIESSAGYYRYSLRTFECLSLDTMRWERLPDLANPRSGLAAVSVRGCVYLIGGRNNHESGNSDAACLEVFDPAAGQGQSRWHRCAPMSVSRNRVAVGVIDDKIYAVGGASQSQSHCSAERYDPDSDQWLPIAPMRQARIGLGVAVVDRLLYAVGGFDGCQRLSSVERYWPEDDRWEPAAAMTQPRSGAGVVAVGKYIYAIGGYDSRQQLRTVERLDTEANQWQACAPMLRPRSALAAVSVDDCVWVFGGYDGYEFVSSVEVYCPRTDSWTEREPMSCGKSGHGVCLGVAPPV
uniref:BTB domain-containing protein n=1 Tax=Macrostomum lignano TaxID=282301 RepID=A0A1I8G6V7_9PLAT